MPRVGRFRKTLFRYPGKGGWTFAPIPARYAPPVTHGWGLWGRTPTRMGTDTGRGDGRWSHLDDERLARTGRAHAPRGAEARAW